MGQVGEVAKTNDDYQSRVNTQPADGAQNDGNASGANDPAPAMLNGAGDQSLYNDKKADLALVGQYNRARLNQTLLASNNGAAATPALVPAAQPGLDRAELERRAQHLHERFEDDGFLGVFSQDTSYSEIAGDLNGLNAADARALNEIYNQKYGPQRGGKTLLTDLSRELSNPYDRYRAAQALNPDGIHPQLAPHAPGDKTPGIIMEPPLSQIATGASVTYRLNLGPYIASGPPKIRAFAVNDPNAVKNGSVSEVAYLGDRFEVSARAVAPGRHTIVFEVQFGEQPPQYYTYNQEVRTPEQLAQSTLNRLPGTAPDPDLYMAAVDQQISDIEQRLTALRANPQANADQIKQLESTLGQLRETKEEVPSKLFDGAVGRPIPMQAVLIAQENSQPVPLQVYAKPLGDNRWAIVDITNPTDARIYEGGSGKTPEEGLRNAWNEFISANNLPAGQIAAKPPAFPPDYQRPAGFPEKLNFGADQVWSSYSDGESDFKAWSNGLGWASLGLAALGVASLFGPGTQVAAPFLFGAAGATGAASGGLNIYDRVRYGNFELFSAETAIDTLSIVGGLASVGGATATVLRAGTATVTLADGTSVTLQQADKLGKFLTITNTVDKAAGVTSGVVIGATYLRQIEKINSDPSLTPEQKQQRTQEVLKQAALFGGLIVLGHGLGSAATRRFAMDQSKAELQVVENLSKGLNGAEIDQLLAKHGGDLVQWAGTDLQGTAARQLLTEVDAAALNGLRDVSAKQAFELLSVLGKDNLNAVAATVGGNRLATMVDMLGPETASGIIGESVRRGRVADLVSFADNLSAARAVELAAPRALGPNSVVVDNNTLIAVEKVLGGTSWTSLDPIYQNSINKVRAQVGLPPLTADPPTRDLAGILGTADIRVPNSVIGEYGASPNIPKSGLELSVKRTDPAYQRVLAELETAPPIGGNKGFADRGAIADAIFAKTAGGAIPRFVTADQDVYVRLAERYNKSGALAPLPNEKKADAVLRQFPNGFEVEIDGHRLFVVPVSPR